MQELLSLRAAQEQVDIKKNKKKIQTENLDTFSGNKEFWSSEWSRTVVDLLVVDILKWELHGQILAMV